MATLYKGNTPLIGGGSGQVKTATTANNSLKLNDVSYNEILQRHYTNYKDYTKSGWYRIGHTYPWVAPNGESFILIISKWFGKLQAESYMFAISLGNDVTKNSVTQLTGTKNNSAYHLIQKIRFAYLNDTQYVDVYIDADSAGQARFMVTSFGGLVVTDPIVESPGTGILSKEFTITPNININN